jgi:hypothetical protein
LKKNRLFQFLKNEEMYLKLLDHDSCLIQKQNTVMRQLVSPRGRLMVTLQFLATGRCCLDLEFSAKISPQAPSLIIPEICQAIYQVAGENT